MLVAAVLALGCSSTPNYEADYSAIAGLELKPAIALANQWRGTKPQIVSSVSPAELDVRFPDGRELKKPLPATEMYVAVAPYVNSTHTCATHYLSSCQGELKSTAFHLTTKDDAGAQLFDGDITSLDNGFFELWLPRHKTFVLHIVQGSRSVDETIRTNDDSPTCITTARLN